MRTCVKVKPDHKIHNDTVQHRLDQIVQRLHKALHNSRSAIKFHV